MLRFLLRAWALVTIVAKRLLTQWGLGLATVCGLVAAISLVLSIPLYANAVYNKVFQEKVGLTEVENEATQSRPPFSFLFFFHGGQAGNVELEDISDIDTYFNKATVERSLGMPLQYLVRYLRTDPFILFPISADENAYEDPRSGLGWYNLGYMNDLEQNVDMIEGHFPVDAEPTEDSVVEVIIGESLATELGLQVGENYMAFYRYQTEDNQEVRFQLPIRIAGVWRAKNPDDNYWMFRSNYLDDVLLVSEGSFKNRISQSIKKEIYTAMWYLVMDGSKIKADQVKPLIPRVVRFQASTKGYLTGLGVAVSPLDALVAYQRASGLLTILLYAFAIPILGLLLAFIGLVSGLSIERQRNEIAILRSRGTTTIQIIGNNLLESVLLGLFALAISIPVGISIAHIMGETRSFLDLSANTDLKVFVTNTTLRAGLIALVVTILVRLFPVISASRHTIITYKQERARMMRPPWWQRVWLDFLLLIPAFYGSYQLRHQGSMVSIQVGDVTDILRNPLLFLVPAIAILAFTLLFLRLLPPLMTFIAWLAAHSKSVGVLLAARQLSRSPGNYSTPLLILIFTLSLSSYTASLAQTLDTHLYTQTYYRVGADMRFAESGEGKQDSPFGFVSAPTQEEQEETGPRWMFIPVSEYLKAQGVEAASRVGFFSSSYRSSTGSLIAGKFVGVDRLDFPRVAFWRNDFASKSLGALMNELALRADGILVPSSFLAQNGLKVGDRMQLTVDTFGQRNQLDVEIVGTYNMFPSWYPANGPFFIGNLDYLFEMAGNLFPYQVWLDTKQDVDYKQLGDKELRKINIGIMNWDASAPIIDKVQRLPERQGVFGLLFIGFSAAAVLTVVGFLLFALFSYRRRFIELGVMRASGLSRRQMALYLASELLFLIVLGGVVGTVLGVWASSYYIPYLQIGTDAASMIPPFQVIIAWPEIFRIYQLFSGLFIITLVILVILLQRMKIFQAIKLGETV